MKKKEVVVLLLVIMMSVVMVSGCTMTEGEEDNDGSGDLEEDDSYHGGVLSITAAQFLTEYQGAPNPKLYKN
ncbi:MAG: hypothetical protein Q4P17_06990 [Methanobacterium sp.]|nr:hypothetical protein [Methanobacterium sp.]